MTGRRFGERRLSGITAFRVGAAIAVVVPCIAALASPDVAVARTVGLAFAVAASTFCPLLLLGIWWRGLTDVGAIAGLLAGGVGSGIAVVYTLVVARHRPAGAPCCSASPPPGASRSRCSRWWSSRSSPPRGSPLMPGGSWCGCTRRSRSSSTVR